MGKKLRGKNKKYIFRRLIFGIFSLMIIFFIGFFSAWKLAQKNYVVVSANISETNNHKEETKQETEEEKVKKEKEPKDEEDALKKSENKEEEKNHIEKSSEKVNEKSLPVLNPYIKDGNKVVYLTFDDGPSATVTPKVLDILKEYNIKATFFVVGVMVNENKELLIRTKNEGHVIANHSYSHNYKYIYESTNNFIEDINKNNAIIKSVLNQKEDVKLIRFPGGSFGKELEPFRKIVQDSGYYYVDWNCLNGDAEGIKIAPDKLVNRLKETADGKEHLVILMHDAPGKETTVQALPTIIEYLKAQGYSFRLLQ